MSKLSEYRAMYIDRFGSHALIVTSAFIVIDTFVGDKWCDITWFARHDIQYLNEAVAAGAVFG